MAKKNNRICKVCGESYNFCPNCAGVTATEKYRTMFCSKNCREVFHTLARYTMKDINKTETQEILFSLDLSKLNLFSEQIKTDIEEIMGTNKKSFKKKVFEEQVAIEEPAVIEPVIPAEF